MTEQAAAPGRIDLRALTADPNFADADRVMVAVRARRDSSFGATDVHRDVLRALAAHARPLAAAATILIALSVAAVTLSTPPSATPPEQMITSWVQADHVPTNGELLTTFEGYGR